MSQLAQLARQPSPRLGICKHRSHPIASASQERGSEFRSFRAEERAVWPVGRAWTATSQEGLGAT
eukprot:8225403-Alexandrium_andersonii.AAC.1